MSNDNRLTASEWMEFYEQLFEEKDPVKSSPLPLDENNISGDKGKKENSCSLAGDQV